MHVDLVSLECTVVLCWTHPFRVVHQVKFLMPTFLELVLQIQVEVQYVLAEQFY